MYIAMQLLMTLHVLEIFHIGMYSPVHPFKLNVISKHFKFLTYWWIFRLSFIMSVCTFKYFSRVNTRNWNSRVENICI